MERQGMERRSMKRREFLKSGLAAGAVALAGGNAAGLADSPATEPLREFAYGDVSLAPGLLQTQFEQTQAILLGLDEDSLLRPWRLRASLPAPGAPMGGWYDEVPLVHTPSGGEGFAPGHAFGQWISALSRAYAVNRDPATRAKVQRLLDLYSPAISGKFYTNFRFPAYNFDKMVIALIDAHQFAQIPNAFALLDRTTDAAEPHLPPRALDRDQVQLKWRASVGDNTTNDYGWDEPYTLPENLYLAAQRGAGERYRKMAPRYLLDETYFDPLSEGKNVLPGHHAYSFCNALSSAMQAYLSAGSEKHLRAAVNAHEMIVKTQSYATGGWGPDETFRKPGTGALYASLTNSKHSFETPCGSYGHFKLTRYLLRVTRDGSYGDSMERVLYNTVLGAKPLQKDGKAFYYSDYSNTGSKFFFDDAWPCCSGTLPQVAADYHILGYFHDRDSLYVNLYLPSTLKWTADNGAQLTLTQSGGYPLDGRIGMLLRASKTANFAIRLRIPAWAQQCDAGVCANERAAQIRVNGVAVAAPVTKGFATLQRKWKDGDRIELELPMPMRLEAIDPEHPDTVALVRGPLVLFALTPDAPKVSRAQLLAAAGVKGQPVWKADTQSGPLLLTPFTEIFEERYRTYMTVS
jgi:DUF1680 family protein